MKKWKCTVCGYIHTGKEPPEKCLVCGADKNKFIEITAEDEAAPQAAQAPKSPPKEPSAAKPAAPQSRRQINLQRLKPARQHSREFQTA